jgi:biofilm PGA synthesis lipoprotein PgaB
MRWLALMTFLLATGLSLTPTLAATAEPAGGAKPGSFTVLSYHEARDEIRDYPDPYAVDTAALVRQFAWLRGNGYTPVSLDAVAAARQGGKPLPAKAVVLTFDDAYLSFYTHVYPLLREFGFPAVLAVVGQWIDNPHGVSVVYGEKGLVSEAQFPSWTQLREMADSGLIELASHTYDLHRGMLANPQGNLQPAATTRAYDPASGLYEDDARWSARVGADLARNSDVIERQTGHRPRTVVWPYGSYNDELIRLAAESGMRIALTLDDGANTPAVPLNALRRTLVEHNPALGEFFLEVRGPRNPEPVRVIQVSLDAIFSPDPQRQEANLSALLEHIDVLKPTHVFLQALGVSQGDGVVDAAYFPNRSLPLRSDLFNRAAWQLASRVDVKVYALMPLAVFQLPHAEVAGLYEDLARYAAIDGLVFDAPTASVAADDPEVLELTRQLTRRAGAFRRPLKTVRTLAFDRTAASQPVSQSVSQPVLQSLSQPASQPLSPHGVPQFESLAENYDYVALVVAPDTTPRLSSEEGLPAPGVSHGPASNTLKPWQKAIFMVRADPLTGRQNAHTVAMKMRTLQLGGAISFGYFDADFAHDEPLSEPLAPSMSLRVYPQKLDTKER